MLDELDPRDGPTKEFLKHHEVMPRAKVAGKMTKDKLLIMVRAGDITTAQFHAGERFRDAYNVIQSGQGISMERVSGGSGGGGHDLRVDMAHLLRKANVALNKEHGHVGGFMREDGILVGSVSPYNLMVEICVKDTSFKELGSLTGLHEERVRTRVALVLQTLGRFFEELDRKVGVSRAPGTIEQIMASRDPEEAT